MCKQNKYDIQTWKPEIIKAATKKFADFAYYVFFTGQGGDWRFCLLMCMKHDYEENDIQFLLEIKFITHSQAHSLRNMAHAQKHVCCACITECHNNAGECQVLVNCSPGIMVII